MPIAQKANEAGIIKPANLAVLKLVFDQTLLIGESPRQRDMRAARIISYFLSGVRDEIELRTLMALPVKP